MLLGLDGGPKINSQGKLARGPAPSSPTFREVSPVKMGVADMRVSTAASCLFGIWSSNAQAGNQTGRREGRDMVSHGVFPWGVPMGCALHKRSVLR